MAGTATLTFAGDATGAQRAAREASDAVESVGSSANSASGDLQNAQQQTNTLGDRMGNLGAATTGATDAIDSLAGGMQALADIQDYARQRAMRLEQAQTDVEQAMADSRQATIDLEQSTIDLNQAYVDGTQATLDVGQAEIDRKQALLDAKKATDDYNKAVKENGKGSAEAQQAAIDMTQANQDLKQADADLTQAELDKKQAVTDAKQATEDGKQANIDARQSQIDLNNAMHEANPPDLSTWSEAMTMVTPLLNAVVGVLALVTAAQWLWNTALFASPITWIVLAVVALIAVIVLIATKTTWFQDLWRVTWGGIKLAASAVGSWFKDTLWGRWIRPAWDAILEAGRKVWDWMKALPGRLKSAFSSIANSLFAPFRIAFNRIADAWNGTVGRLSWTVPGWVPGVGGNSISAPRLPKFHSGVGSVPGIPGTETLAILQAGETVLPNTGSGTAAAGGWVAIRGDAVIDALTQMIADRVSSRGGRAAQLGIRVV